MRAIAKQAAVLIATALLSACGGGGSSQSPSTNSTPPTSSRTSAEGLWTGTFGGSESVGFLVLEDGSIWGLYSESGNSAVVAGAFQAASSTQTATQIGASAVSIFIVGEQPPVSCSFSGAFVPLQSINGSLTCTTSEGQGGEDVEATYDTDYDQSPSLSTIAGTYSGTVASNEGTESASLTVTASGIVSGVGTSTGCDISGTAKIHSSGNVYDISVTEANISSCAAKGQSFNGVAYFDSSSHILRAITLTSDRSNGLLFVGND